MSQPRYRSVILDVDSTLCGVEGIDWLAERRGAVVCERVRELTDRAMRGDIALDAVYAERLDLVSPSAKDIASLSEHYISTLAPGAIDAVARLRDCGVRVVLVSGGIRGAILGAAAAIGLSATDVHAVDVRFSASGGYAGFDCHSPLATADGKRLVAGTLSLPAPVLAVGDGMTDLAMRPVLDAFAAYTGFVHRSSVVSRADLSISSFHQLATIILA